MTIYSVRDSLGRELWWTTNRRAALGVAEQLDEPGRYVRSNGDVHTDDATPTPSGEGLRPWQLPVAVYKSTVVKAKAAPVRCPVCKDAACETKSRQCGKGA